MAYSSFLNPYGNSLPGGSGGDLTKKKGLTNVLRSTVDDASANEYQTQGQRSSEYGTLNPSFMSIANGGTQQENAALEQGVMTPLSGAYAQAKQGASNRLARTRNSAGYGSFLGDLARSQSKDQAQAGFDIQNEKFARKMQGLQGLMQLYGIDTSFLTSLGGQKLQALGIGNSIESRRKGKLGTLSSVVDIAGKVGAGIAGAM